MWGETAFSQDLETCKELQLTKLELPPDATSALSKQEESHLLARSTGGLHERYGGFMKKMDELYPLDGGKRQMEVRSLARDMGASWRRMQRKMMAWATPPTCSRSCWGAGDQRGEPPPGGQWCWRCEQEIRLHERLKEAPTWKMKPKSCRSDAGVFMRRVSRPEVVDGLPENYGGFLKRFAEPTLRGRRRKLLQGSSWNGEKDTEDLWDFKPLSHQWPEAPPSLPHWWETAALVCCVESRVACII